RVFCFVRKIFGLQIEFLKMFDNSERFHRSGRQGKGKLTNLDRFLLMIPLLCSMKSILVLGAGRSSTHLIKYLLDNAASNDWKVTIGDMSLQNAQEKLGSASRGSAIAIDLNNEKETARLVSNADIVISLLPAALHPQVAKYCLGEGKHFLTASYVSDDLKSFDSDAKKKGLILLNECGLDPGIDHLSAMKIIDEIRGVGGIVTSFESFTGGLIAPETDPENPWRYKFTWNPRNVVT